MPDAAPRADQIDRLGDLRGKRVLVRSDLNVPLDGDRITDDGRIRASVPTIRRLADAGARVVVTAHLGRPKGEPDPRYSLRAGRRPARRAAGRRRRVRGRHRGGVGQGDRRRACRTARWRVLENVRFNEGETSKDDAVRGRVRRPAGVARRRLRQRRVRGRAPQAGVACTTSRSGCRTPWAGSSPPRSTCCAGSPRTPSGRTSWCSAAPRSPTSSASSTTCSARPTGC